LPTEVKSEPSWVQSQLRYLSEDQDSVQRTRSDDLKDKQRRKLLLKLATLRYRK